MTTQPSSLDDDVNAYLDLTDRIEQLTAQRDTIKARLAAHGTGAHQTAFGVTVTVTAPPRRFNLERAWSMLTEDQKDVCTSPDAAKVKKQLPGVLVDDCYDEGTGTPRVTVK